MINRSKLRHACYRMKNGVATPANETMILCITSQMAPHMTWKNFGVVWDVMVTSQGKVLVIKPEHDTDFIHKTLLKMGLYVESNTPLTKLSEREFNVVEQVRPLLLEGIMDWMNYDSVWGVSLEKDTNVIKTVLFNAPKTQIEVTAEMIEASKKDADGAAFTPPPVVELTAKPVTDEQKRLIDEMLASKKLKLD